MEKVYTQEDYDRAVEVQRKKNIRKMDLGNVILYGIPALIAFGLIYASQVL